MASDNILVEREFNISLDGQSYEVKATAVFMGGFGFELTTSGMKEVGVYHLNFTVRGRQAEIYQPDKTRYSREEARRAAEIAFSSGQVEAHARSQIQSWIYLVL